MSLLVCSAVFFPMTAAIVGYLIGRKDKDGRDYFVFVVSAMEVVLFLSIFIITTVNVSDRLEEALPGVCGTGSVRFHSSFYVVCKRYIFKGVFWTL